jgi:RNA ligase
MDKSENFQSFGKIARYNRPVLVTEKLDGTNAHVAIFPPADGGPQDVSGLCLATSSAGLRLYAGSRNRYLTLSSDNYGFAEWCASHADELFTLGAGRHYGEWWGRGIQRGYDLVGRRFSLFNTTRYASHDLPPSVGTVPVLYEGEHCTAEIRAVLHQLAAHGSHASPGFMRPEGVIVTHTASGSRFKITLENDDQRKSA